MIFGKLPEDFDVNAYRFFNDDLKDLNDNQLKVHYINNGKNEGRKYKYDLPEDFYVYEYMILNKDLKNLNYNQLKVHYMNNGINEGRKYKLELPEDFDVNDYRLLNSDLKDLNDNQLKVHYMNNGINECRIYKKKLPKNLNENKNIFNINYFFNTENKCKYFDDCKNVISEFGIAVSLYIDKNTPYERVLRSKKCIKSVVLNFINNLIIIVIDYEITDDYINYLLELTKNYNNVLIFKNIENKGIAETKNICLKLLEYYNIKYFCLLDDDIKIKENFENYIINIFINTNIPLISNSPNNYKNININDISFKKVKYFECSDTHDYYGNLIIITNKSLNKYGYFYIFENKIGVEHIEIIERYLLNTDFKGISIYLENYIENDEIINSKNTLFLHSINYIDEEYSKNVELLKKIKNKNKYIDYNFNYNNIIKIKDNYLDIPLYHNDIKLNKYIFIKTKDLNNLIYNKDIIESKLNYIDFILWINMDKDNERKKYMYSILEDLKIPNIRIKAVNGKEYISNTKIDYKFERQLSNGEIGCTFSHIKAINFCKNLDGKYFMICEDDISFKNILIFNNDLEKIISEAPDFDILLLYKTYFKNLNNKYEKWSDFYIENPIDHIGGTVCYIINSKAVKKFCEKIYFLENEIILNDNNLKIDVADIFIYKNLNTYVYKYNFIETYENNSTIHLEHSDYQNKSNFFQKKLLIDDIHIF